jgi:hypothetical protein
MTTKTSDVIPKSLLDLLDEQWPSPEPGFQMYDVAWCYPERRGDPSYYHLNPNSRGADKGGLRYAEAEELIDSGILHGLAKKRDDGIISINEHAAHAIDDFAREVYGAYHVLKRRLKIAASAQKQIL